MILEEKSRRSDRFLAIIAVPLDATSTSKSFSPPSFFVKRKEKRNASKNVDRSISQYVLRTLCVPNISNARYIEF